MLLFSYPTFLCQRVSSKNIRRSGLYPNGAKLLEERARLFRLFNPLKCRGLKRPVQMLNFAVFHFFPGLNVPANDIRVTSGELKKSWISVLAELPRSVLLPWTLMSDSRNEMQQDRQPGSISTYLYRFSGALLGIMRAGWCQTCNMISDRYHVFFWKKKATIGINCAECAFGYFTNNIANQSIGML